MGLGRVPSYADLAGETKHPGPRGSPKGLEDAQVDAVKLVHLHI